MGTRSMNFLEKRKDFAAAVAFALFTTLLSVAYGLYRVSGDRLRGVGFDSVDLLPNPVLVISLSLAFGAILCAASLLRSSDLNFVTGTLLGAIYVIGLLQTLRFSLDPGVSGKAEYLNWPVVLTGSSLMVAAACSQLLFAGRQR